MKVLFCIKNKDLEDFECIFYPQERNEPPSDNAIMTEMVKIFAEYFVIRFRILRKLESIKTGNVLIELDLCDEDKGYGEGIKSYLKCNWFSYFEVVDWRERDKALPIIKSVE